MLQVRPVKSLVRNWGQDGTGLHSGICPTITKEEISADYLYELNNTPIVLRNDVAKLLKFLKLPSRPIGRFFKISIILIQYIAFRFTNRRKICNAE